MFYFCIIFTSKLFTLFYTRNKSIRQPVQAPDHREMQITLWPLAADDFLYTFSSLSLTA
ncbi:hypothetical protein ACRRTK_012098 [Alexandromys fortis]